MICLLVCTQVTLFIEASSHCNIVTEEVNSYYFVHKVNETVNISPKIEITTYFTLTLAVN